MTDIVLENWIRKESCKAFTKDDLFIGEIRLHNVLCNQIPSAMLLQGYNQQSVRKGLLQMIDDGFAEELRAESKFRRLGRPPGPPEARPEGIAVETDVLLETWIRKESAGVAFSKEDTFIGEIRLHNVLCNRVPATMLGRGYSQQSVRKSLLKMIEGGFSEELQKESCRRRSLEKPPITVTENVAATRLPYQSVIYNQQIGSSLERMRHSYAQSLDPTIAFGDINTVPSSQLSPSEVPTPPFCIQHGILKTLQSTLETSCFKFSRTHCPALLARRKWTCPHAGELNAWTKELRRSFDIGELPTAILPSDTAAGLTATLKELDDLRHTAVHRVPINGARLVEFIKNSIATVRMLGDEDSAGEITAIMAMVNRCFDETVRSKMEVSLALGVELEQLEMERKKLEQREGHIRQTAAKGAKDAEEEMERSMVRGLEALKLGIHVGGGF